MNQLIKIQLTDWGKDRLDMYNLAFRPFALMALSFSVPFLQDFGWMGLLMLCPAFASAFFVWRHYKSKIELRPSFIWVDSEGVRIDPKLPPYRLWSDVEEVRWPIKLDGIILLEPRGPAWRFNEINRQDRGLLVSLIRKHCPSARHLNWEKFCLRFAIPALQLTKYRTELSRFPRLHDHLKHQLDSQAAESVGGNEPLDEQPGWKQALALFTILSPIGYLATASAIWTSAVLNSYLIAGQWYAPVTNVCLRFSGFLVIAALISQLVTTWFPEVVITARSTNGPNQVHWLYVLIGLAYIFLLPVLMVTAIWIGGSLGHIVLIAGLIFPILIPEICRRNPDSKKKQPVRESASKFWDSLSIDKLTCKRNLSD